MQIYEKIKAFTKKKKHSPDYSRGQWWFKCGLLGLCAIALDMVGQKIGSIDIDYEMGRLTAATAHGSMYGVYLGAQGMLIGLAVWRLLEMYWWAKDRVNDSHL